MTVDQTIVILNFLVHAGLPIAVAFVTDSRASSATKALVNIGLGLISTAIISIVAAIAVGHPIDWFTILFAFVTGFVVSGASYAHVWKPTGVAPAVALKGVGAGSSLAD